MLVYLATYPRSGNSFLKRIIRYNFGYPPASIKRGVKSFDAGLKVLSKQGVDFKSDEMRQVVAVRLGGNKWRDRIPPLDLELLTDGYRRQLAEAKEPYFVKLHHLPFEQYFPGEYVIQFVRHPGAVLWSYFRYLNDAVIPRREQRLFSTPAPTLQNVILGNVQFGSWSDYHIAWSRIQEQMGSRFLMIYYEDVLRDFPRVVSQIGHFLSLPTVIDATTKPRAQKEQAKYAEWNLRGTSEKYELFYTPSQLNLLWNKHGPTAERHGYAPPNFELAVRDEQIERLSRTLDSAWQQAEVDRAAMPETIARLSAALRASKQARTAERAAEISRIAKGRPSGPAFLSAIASRFTRAWTRDR